MPPPDPRLKAFREIVKARLPVTPAPGLPSLRLHLANERSGLGRLLAELDSGFSPYWAHVWAGGLALANHIEAEPDCVRGRTVIDYGTGSGLVAIAAAKAGARYISPFVGRVDDIGASGMDLIADICAIYSNYDFDTEVLVASIRGPLHVVEAAKMGADVATLPPAVLRQLYQHPLTDKGLDAFLKDWAKTGQSILGAPSVAV